MIRRCRPLAAVLAFVVAAIPEVGMPGVAHAATPPALRLVSQDLAVVPNGAASFAVTVSGDLPPDPEIVIEAHTLLASPRADLHHVLDGSLNKASVGFAATSLAHLTPDASGRYTLTLPTSTTATNRQEGGALLASPGIYPVSIELRSHNKKYADISTFLVQEGEQPPGSRLSVAVVLPLGGGPTLQPDDTTVIDSVDRTRIQSAATVLASSPTPLTVVPGPELLDGLARSGLPADTQVRSALSAAIGTRQVLATPYVRMDPAAAAASTLSDEFTHQLTAGEDALGNDLPGVTTDRSAWVSDGQLDDTSLGLLRSLGVRRVVLPASGLAPTTGGPPTSATLTSTVEVATSDASQPLEVAVADPALSAAFDHHDDPVLAAYQFVAELDAIALDTGGTAGQGIVVVPPRTWQPDTTFVSTVLSLVSANPYLQPVTLDDYFRAVPRATSSARRTLAPAKPADLGSYAQGLALTRISLAGFASMLPPNDPLPVQLEDTLRASESADLSAAQRSAYLGAVNTRLGSLRDVVEPVATRRITLTGTSSEIPLTLRRKTDRTIQVKVHLASPKLTFPQNDFLVTLDSDAVQRRVPVSARASGTFPLTVSIVTPSGDIPIAPSTELTVQATALSGLGIVLTAGAVLVLATWWVRHVRRSRRQRRRDTHPSAGTAAGPGSSSPPPATLPAP